MRGARGTAPTISTASPEISEWLVLKHRPMLETRLT
jgi:hypothetical protein